MSAQHAYGIPNVAPAVGMPATVCIGSDRYPATVVGVIRARGRRRLSIAIQIDGGDGALTHYIASASQNGVYRAADGGGRRAYVGRADSYRDPHI